IVEERGKFGVAPSARINAELLCDGDDELDHVLAVIAGVAVVRLDDVAEQKGVATVGVTELEGTIDTDLPLLREQSQEPDEREDEQNRADVVDGQKGDGETQGSECAVDGPDPPHEAQMCFRLEPE